MELGIYYILTGILFILAITLTFFAFGKIDKEIKDHEKKDSSVQDEIKRSHEFETASFRKYLPIQIWLYVITIVASLIALAIYIFMV